MDRNTNPIKIKTESLYKLWQELLAISQQKVALVQNSGLQLDIDKLNMLLKQYQNKMAEFDNLDREIRGLYDTLNPEYQKTAARIRKIALVIKKNDNLAESEVRELMRQTQVKLQSVRNNKKAQQAYLQEDVNTGGWFIDQTK